MHKTLNNLIDGHLYEIKILLYKNMWHTLMLALFLSLAGVSGTETDATKSVSVIEGDSVTLHTNVTEILNGDNILWLFGPKDSLISQIGRMNDFTTFFVTDDVRFRGRLQVDQKSGSLTIRNSRIRHSGQYKITMTREEIMSKIFIVNISAVVSDTDRVKSVSVSVKEGDPVTLNPDAEIHKDALMLWRFVEKGILLAKVDIETNKTSLYNDNERFRDRLKLDHQTGSLIIKNTRITDSGLYELQIRGSESLQRFFVSVSALPDPGLSPGAIAGICLGVIVPLLLLVAAAGALLYYRHRISKLKSKITVTDEEKKSLMEGDSVTLSTGLTEIQRDHMIEWWYEGEGSLIAKINGESRETSDGADGRFRSKLSLNAKGDLTISNSRTIHSGLYQLKISSSNTRKPTYKRFSVTITVKSKQVQEGESVTLQIEAQIQRGDLILWTFGASNLLVIRDELTGTESIHEDFRNRLELDHQNGDLTIRNITVKDSGHFKLQIINHQKTTFRRFNVTVTVSTGNQVSDSVNVVMPLLSGDAADGENQQQETTPL
ncbi:uncharacterized protein LOC113040278 [Carassius auratus]|uniref:Uncharacterized protein LOC113040278 n=1 Tax=Carassius auratus TaxID=7957 RepID=A0A6P6J976_CARAU|nr:uncharacterized protein LOC113040278 [Carassius auratus]